MSTKLTVVYDADTIQDVKALLDAHPWSAMSHSHAIHERDAALREIERLQKRVAEMQAPHARGEVDSTTLRLASLLELSGALPESCTMRAATELRRLIAENEALQAQLEAVGAGGVEPLRKRCLHQIIEPVQPLVCDYCGALTPDPWHSSGMLHGKMSKHIHSCDAYERGDVEYESHGFARAIEQAHGIKATNPESNK